MMINRLKTQDSNYIFCFYLLIHIFTSSFSLMGRYRLTQIDRQRFTKVFTQCLGFSSAFTGSLGQIAANPSAHSPVVSEILPGRGKHNDSQKSVQESDASSGVQQELYLEGIPSMPPWLPVGTASRLYSVLADVLRLAGVSAISGTFFH